VTANGEISLLFTSLPVYQLHYAVCYNSSTVDHAAWANSTQSTVLPGPGEELKASNICARHYAETFLTRLFQLDAWLNELCATYRPPVPRVVIHTTVVVRVYGTLVSHSVSSAHCFSNIKDIHPHEKCSC